MKRNYEITSVVKEDGTTKFYVNYENKFMYDIDELTSKIDYLTNCVCQNSMEIEMGDNERVADILEKENEKNIAELEVLKEAKEDLQVKIYRADKKERQEKVFAEVSKKENMEKLFDFIRGLVNLPELKFSYEIFERRDGEKYISFDSENIENPLIAVAWKQFNIGNFNSQLTAKESYYDKDYSKPCPEVGYFFGINFNYKQWDGGSNGTNIADAYFTENGEWQFRTAKEGR